jgi:preprotein translocase subunit SecA
MGLTGPGTSEDDLADAATSRDALIEHVQTLAEQALEAKEQQYGAQDWGQAERYVLLRTIDSLWVEHLTEVDDMRRGIGLRGYAQQDPLNEFRKEAFRLYQELRDLIRRQVANTILRITVTRNDPPPSGAFPMPGPGQPPRPGQSPGGSTPGGPRRALPPGRDPHAGHAHGPLAGPLAADPMRGARESAGVGASAAAGAAGGPKPGYTPTGARIGRNDPCWCGSGNKYKKCHGR